MFFGILYELSQSDNVKERKLSKIFLKERESKGSLSVVVYENKKLHILVNVWREYIIPVAYVENWRGFYEFPPISF